jgi:hypothetical protein
MNRYESAKRISVEALCALQTSVHPTFSSIMRALDPASSAYEGEPRRERHYRLQVGAGKLGQRHAWRSGR